MKRSGFVSAPLLAAAALGVLTGCRRQDVRRCVDTQNRVVDDRLCAAQPQVSTPGPYGPTLPIDRFYYGGSGGSSIGSIVTGGAYTPSPGVSYSSGTTRGGFGSTHGGSGDSAGGDAGGGHGGGSGGE